LFTATSAVCVTGLVVRDTWTQFSTFGLTVLASLIQIGGLGILTFTATFALVGGPSLSKRERARLARAVDPEKIGKLEALLGRVFVGTFVTEAVGAAALYAIWRDAFPDPFVRAGQAAFHAISAFCNAGFALFPDNASLTAFASDPWTCLAIGSLIVLGGLGFPVLAELAVRGRPVTRHARWVVLATATLIALGAVLLAAFEGYDLLSALFQSVTLRTAGFNTVPLGALGLPAVALCVAWMLVGGSPAGTAGGMKTTTLVAAFSALSGRPRLDRPTARRAARLAAVFLAAFVGFVVATAVAQGEFHRRLVFEVASALATVGLTMDYTTELGTAARLTICLAMFAGRVGPFALAAAILPWREERVEAPSAEERVLLG
jgi:trk system potassium uptake protein TrkH